MKSALFTLVCAFGLVTVACPQTATDLQRKYPLVTSYAVRPGVLMTPRYTEESQVCEMSIQRQVANRLDSYMTDELIKEIANELVPPSVRGKPWNGSEWNGVVLSAGVATTTTYVFENLSISVARRSDETRLGPTVVNIKWKNRTCKAEPRVDDRE